jgi:DNA polymerase-1
MKLVFDIETDGIDATQVWCIVAQDVETKKIYKWKPDDIDSGISFLMNAEALIGHNIIGYDAAVLDKLYGTNLLNKKLYDTWIMSQVLCYKRKHKHGLGGWGEHLGYSKFEFNDWSQFSEEMLTYCVRDVELNTKVYEILMQEFKDQSRTKPLIAKGIRAEHNAAVFEAKVRMNGWLFDVDAANKLHETMCKEIEEIESRIHPQLPEMTIWVDKQPKTAKYTKKGDFTAVTRRLLTEYLGHEPEVDGWDPKQEFQRSYKTQVTLGNMEEVKEYLYTIGWKPDDWNYKKVGYEFHKTSPKLTTTSLELLGDIGRDIDRYYTTRSRRSILEGWLKEIKGQRLHGRMWVIGTPTFRARHEVITNLPSVEAAWGKEMRSLFICEDGYKVVGADSAGNQMRALCHYIGDDDFTKEVTDGDIHSYNASILGSSRGDAKRWLYAYLFGGGGRKLGTILTGKPDDKAGNASKQKYQSAIPGLAKIKSKLDHIFQQTKNGYGDAFIPGLDGRRVYVGSAHQSLNYLLQSAEAITCKAAIGYAMEKIAEEKLDAYPVIFYHDEMAWVAKESDAERVKEICIESFREAPKQFNVQCMDGDGVIGSCYADVH